MGIKIIQPNLTDYQKKILYCDSRFTITEAATKTGKTFSHIYWLFEQACKGKQGRNYWWVAPSYAQSSIAFSRMSGKLRGAPHFTINLTKQTITTPIGSVISFKTSEKPDNLYGEDVYACVFDEFTRAREEAWYAIRSTLTATKGKCKLIGNMKGRKNWGHKLGMKAKANAAHYQYFKITAWDAVDAGILDREEVEQAKRDLPDAVFKELYECIPNEDGSNPFGLMFIKDCIMPLSGKPAKYFGADLAKSVDWTVIVGLDDDGKIAYFDRFQKDWRQTKQEVKSVVNNNNCFIDSTGVGDPITEDLQREMVNLKGYKFSSMSKQQLMEGLAVGIQKSIVSVLDGIMRDELEAFEYEYTRTGVRYTSPSGVHDDCVDALALAFSCYSKNKMLSDFDFR